MAKGQSADRLPVQAWDEINVTHARVQEAQKVEMVAPKEMKQILKMMKSKKGKKRNG